MNLIFYSGGGSRENRRLARELAEMLQGREGAKLAFIPSERNGAAADFRAFRRAMRGTGATSFRAFHIDRPLSREREAALFACDAIFLGGGNTFHFLRNLRARGLVVKLRAYAKRGGILLGLSAGSILMTPRIETALVPSEDCDENEVGIKDLRALRLVGFEFSPHYTRSVAADRELREYSRRSKHPIYACADGEGIVVRGRVVRFVGRVRAYQRGQSFLVRS